jgi:hypothetical protein
MKPEDIDKFTKDSLLWNAISWGVVFIYGSIMAIHYLLLK